jgi:hypothetical protein
MMPGLSKPICVMRVLGDALDRDFEMKANTQKVAQKRS